MERADTTYKYGSDKAGYPYFADCPGMDKGATPPLTYFELESRSPSP